MIEHKALGFELSDMDKEHRTAIIAHAVYDNIDRYGDICRKGMFDKTWKETKAQDIFFDIDHDKNRQPGKVTAVFDSEKKAFTKVSFGNHTLGNDTMIMMDEGIIRGASFEYIAEKKSTTEIKGRKVRELKEVRHLATTVTLALPPVNPEAGVISVTKSMDVDTILGEYKSRIDNLERFCRDTNASDECILNVLNEIKAAKEFLYGEEKIDLKKEVKGDEFRRKLLMITMNMESKAWDESKHPRAPKGTEDGGQFVEVGSDHKHTKGDKVKVPANLTTDPQKKQGQVGVVTGTVDEDVIGVKFPDNTHGLYQTNALMAYVETDRYGIHSFSSGGSKYFSKPGEGTSKFMERISNKRTGK